MSNVGLVILDTFDMTTEYAGPSRIYAYMQQHSIPVSLVQISINASIDLSVELSKIPKKCNIVGFSIFSTNAEYVFKFCHLLKERDPNVVVFVGGILADEAYKYILNDCKFVDFVVLGDGERTIYDIALQYEEGTRQFDNHPHIATRNDSFAKVPDYVDIEAMPRISREFFEKASGRTYQTARIVGSTGCTAHCSFCALSGNCKSNRKWQGRQIEDIFDEIVMINRKYDIRSFAFTDNSFEDPGSLGKERVRRFCELCVKYHKKLHFWCYLRAETFNETDGDLVKMMRLAGFTHVFIGFEANNDEDLILYQKRATTSDNHISYNLFSSCGIDITPGFIMFNPYSTIERIRKNLAFLCRYKEYHLRLYTRHIDIYCGTKIYDKVKSDSLLLPTYSYINTDQYSFVDPKIEAISRFVKNNFNSSRLYKYDDEVQSFRSAVNYLRAINPEIFSEYADGYFAILNKIAERYGRFFQILYADNGLCKAEAIYPDFYAGVISEYKHFKLYKLKMMKNIAIRNALMR